MNTQLFLSISSPKLKVNVFVGQKRALFSYSLHHKILFVRIFIRFVKIKTKSTHCIFFVLYEILVNLIIGNPVLAVVSKLMLCHYM